MAPFSGRQMFNNARSKIGKSRRLNRIITKLSIRRLRNYAGDGRESKVTVDNDDISSIGNPVSPAGPSTTTMVNNTVEDNSGIANAPAAEPKDVVVPPPKAQPDGKATGLLLLPQELFDMVTSHLNHAHIVLLALVNKELMARFINSCTKLQLLTPDDSSPYSVLNAFIKGTDSPKYKIRGVLLSLLDYDMEDVVYCYKCKKLHDPFVTFKDRAYADKKATRCIDWSMEHHMPPRATRKMLRCITKRRIHGAEYRHLLQQVNNTVTTYQKGIMAQTSLRMRYRGEDLILRRQQVISSIDKSALALWLFGQQLLNPPPSGNASLSLPKVYLICNHRSWDSVYSPLVQQLVEPLCKLESYDEIPKHSPKCFTNEPLDVSKQEGHMIYERLKWLSSDTPRNPMDMPTLLGDVLGCDRCTTDFSIDVTPLPEPFGWGFVLTTWLDLGKLDFCSKWDSHRDSRPFRDHKRTNGHGDICEKFEDISSRLDYRPRISALNLERMHNYGWSERVASGRDKYISWTSGHSCNPATGWIEDPDPLEEADR
ncbi:hypothetical protein F4677DRAFT_455523 [Hypoxylon crocopeplum]|nr:hypothetical protein F4677DRAFT_455523 [Hypoxylon crocopeplum]